RLGKTRCWKARRDSIYRQPESGCRQLLSSRTKFLESGHCLSIGQGRLLTGIGHLSTNEGYLSTATGVLHNLGSGSMIPVDRSVTKNKKTAKVVASASAVEEMAINRRRSSSNSHDEKLTERKLLDEIRETRQIKMLGKLYFLDI
ncbi:hypothetical protein Taro_053322, partial [Colocasia esculenta]|nr:hypothetical protein [Colocasia esculenta]